jgi:diacylglycerol diphosphate phosphatase/phosphatidate phosphatase
MSLVINFKDKRTRLLILSYAKDWVLVFVMLALFLAIDKIHPFHREFSINDTTLMHEYTVHEAVPMWLAGVSLVY